MKFTPTAVDGVVQVDAELREDDRGWFARAYAAEEFEAAGLAASVVHGNMSYNHRAGTMRGLHLSLPGHAEAKFVRCTRGAILDIAVDVRPDSPTYLRSVAVELSADNHRGLYLPPHMAHAYLTLADDTEVLYLVSVGYRPGAEMGYRYDDPAFALQLPVPVVTVSEKDLAWAPFDDAANRAAFTTGLPG